MMPIPYLPPKDYPSPPRPAPVCWRCRQHIADRIPYRYNRALGQHEHADPADCEFFRERTTHEQN